MVQQCTICTLRLETELSKPEVSVSAEFWKKLMQENSSLRALVNGHLYSVDLDFL
ncbi:MAG: hypothetical protein GXY01_08110 [Clostridiales bacterium]|nr:hypothetical protein [Clostridiales bacterium]